MSSQLLQGIVDREPLPLPGDLPRVLPVLQLSGHLQDKHLCPVLVFPVLKGGERELIWQGQSAVKYLKDTQTPSKYTDHAGLFEHLPNGCDGRLLVRFYATAWDDPQFGSPGGSDQEHLKCSALMKYS